MIAAFVAVLVFSGWLISSPGLFTVDEYFYVRAAEAMATNGSLFFRQFDVSGAPALDMNFAQPTGEEGFLAPQYPSGYALIAAPFYAMSGVKGLSLLNACAGIASLGLTYRIACRLNADRQIAYLATGLLAFASFWSTYLYAIWPHMLALAFVLGVIERLLAASGGNMTAAGVAGLLAGICQNIRIDAIVLLPAAIVWFRLFNVTRTRLLSGAFAGGFAPGLIVAALVNYQKFGDANPFTYGNSVEANNPVDFAAPAILAAIFLLCILLVDARKLFARAKALHIIAIVVIFAISPPGRQLMSGYWYSLFDSQAYQHIDRQIGIERNSWGWLVFYGFSKKALAQSMPYIGILLLTISRFFRGGLGAPHVLLLIVAGAFATLYSYNSTDSGLGLNARFLLPLAPVAAILAACELKTLAGEVGMTSPKRALLLAAVSFSAFLVFRTGLRDGAEFHVPLDLYPQLAILFVLIGATALYLMRHDRKIGRLSIDIASIGIGVAMAVGVTDVGRDQSYRRFVSAQAHLYQAAVTPGSLILTMQPVLFAEEAGKKRLGVAYPGIGAERTVDLVIEAYFRAGRCVALQGSGAREWASRRAAFITEETAAAPGMAYGGISRIVGGDPVCGENLARRGVITLDPHDRAR